MIARALAFLAKVPGLAWVALFVVTSLVAAGTALYLRGVHHGEVTVHDRTLKDSVHVAVEKKDTAHAHSATVLAVATKARSASDALRQHRREARAAALPALIDPGLTTVHTLVALDDSLSVRDSVTIAVQAGAIDTLQAEIAARASLDTLRVNQIALAVSEPDHHTTAKIVGGAIAGVLAVLAVLHFVR